jgi:deoxyribose-phosphate aldolase
MAVEEPMKVQTFAMLFDHSIVRPNVVRSEIIQGAETAARLGTATLIVQPHYVRLAVDLMRGTGIPVGTVAGFPHGSETPEMKAFQTRVGLDLGAQEIDMVMNIPALKNGEHELFVQDIRGVVEAAQGYKVKVILENCFLTQEEKWRACKWVVEAGAHFVKTATAFAEGGATLEDVRLMYEAVEGKCVVKASGGVRTIQQVLAFLQAGARRFGSTRSAEFVQAYQALSDEERQPFAEFIQG